MRKRVLFAALAAAILAVGPSAPASAVKRKPPDVVLHAGYVQQQGRLGSYCWSYPSGGGTRVTGCADAVWGWPHAKEVRRGKRARIVIHRRERPKKLDLRAWRKVDPDTKAPIGPGKDVRFTLHPRLRDGRRVAWGARFRLPRTPGSYYLDMFARWSPGDTEYSFRLRLT